MKIDREAPIGVFDSGVGGLTVAREIMRNLPSEKIVYFGDTARVPYGSKSKETIIRYSRQIIRFLQQQKVKAIVVACNTASAFALDAVRDEFDIPIIGVIEPGAKVAAAQTRNKRVGIIGTVGTVGSGIHAEYLKHLDPEITVFGKACPLFVPLVEEGWLHDPVADEVAARYLKELQDKQVDTLILGRLMARPKSICQVEKKLNSRFLQHREQRHVIPSLILMGLTMKKYSKTKCLRTS